MASELSMSVESAQLADPRSDLAHVDFTSVVQVTESIFPESTIEIEVEADPSEPDLPFVVFKVYSGGRIDELLSKETEWNRRVRDADSDYPGQLRLLICPSE